MNSKKVMRQRAALTRLEATYEKFKAAKEDKKPWTSTRNGREIFHKGRSYAEECNRLVHEIELLKSKLSHSV